MPEDKDQPSILADPLMESLAQDLGVIIDDEDGKTKIKPVEEKETPKPEDKKSEEQPKDDKAKPAEPAPIKAKLRKSDDRIREIVDRRIEEKVPKKEEAPTLPPKTAAHDDAEGLSKEQLDELADAAHAEKFDPEKYKGFRTRMREFYKKVDKWVEEHGGDPDRTFDANDPEFMKFVKTNKPDWGGQRETVKIDRIAEEKLAKKLSEREKVDSERLSRIEREAKEAKAIPAIQRDAERFSSEIEETLKSEDPLESDIFTGYRESANQLAVDYLRVLNGLDSIGEHNPADLQKRHQWLVQFITNKGDEFAKKASQEDKVRGGKTFVTPSQWASLQASKNTQRLANSWTFTKEDVLRMLREHAAAEATKAVEAEVKRLEAKGFTRAKAKQLAKAKEDPKPEGSPKIKPTQAVGANAAKTVEHERHIGHEIIEDLELQV